MQFPAASGPEQPRACRCGQELRESHVCRSKGALVAVACKAVRPREDASFPVSRPHLPVLESRRACFPALL